MGNVQTKKLKCDNLGDFQTLCAGSDTTSNTLNWAMLYMAQNPDVLKRVQRELDTQASTTGTKVRKMNDRRNTPYTEATLHEIQRKGNILPMAVFHYTNR